MYEMCVYEQTPWHEIIIFVSFRLCLNAVKNGACLKSPKHSKHEKTGMAYINITLKGNARQLTTLKIKLIYSENVNYRQEQCIIGTQSK